MTLIPLNPNTKSCPLKLVLLSYLSPLLPLRHALGSLFYSRFLRSSPSSFSCSFVSSSFSPFSSLLITFSEIKLKKATPMKWDTIERKEELAPPPSIPFILFFLKSCDLHNCIFFKHVHCKYLHSKRARTFYNVPYKFFIADFLNFTNVI